MGLIHRSCMQKWLTSSNTTACELCKCQIQLRARKRGVCEWMRWTVAEWGAERERHRGGHDESDSDGRHLLGDGICFMFLTPMALTSAGLCAKSMSLVLLLLLLYLFLVVHLLMWLLAFVLVMIVFLGLGSLCGCCVSVSVCSMMLHFLFFFSP